jgi:2,4-dichlorophenol 6-monooxygenase
MSIPGSEPVEVPVLIVGAGPAGLALSVALSRYGVENLVVERHWGTAHTPRAHIINQRTVKIFRHLGISDRFHAVATPQHLMANNLWVTTLAGLEVARSETWGTSAVRAADYRMASPEPMANCPQTVLEPMLLAAARDAGADIRFGWEFISLAQDQEGVTSVVRQRDGEATLTVRSRYVVGADGARSRVLGQAGDGRRTRRSGQGGEHLVPRRSVPVPGVPARGPDLERDAGTVAAAPARHADLP